MTGINENTGAFGSLPGLVSIFALRSLNDTRTSHCGDTKFLVHPSNASTVRVLTDTQMPRQTEQIEYPSTREGMTFATVFRLYELWGQIVTICGITHAGLPLLNKTD